MLKVLMPARQRRMNSNQIHQYSLTLLCIRQKIKLYRVALMRMSLLQRRSAECQCFGPAHQCRRTNPNALHQYIRHPALQTLTKINKNKKDRQLHNELACSRRLFLHLQTLCNEKDQCISYTCIPSFIHTIT